MRTEYVDVFKCAVCCMGRDGTQELLPVPSLEFRGILFSCQVADEKHLFVRQLSVASRPAHYSAAGLRIEWLASLRCKESPLVRQISERERMGRICWRNLNSADRY